MKKEIKEFTGRKARIVVVAPHEKAEVSAYWEKEDLPFIGIPDPDGRLGKLYGQECNLMKLGRMPALFIIDTKGVVLFSQYARSMADIPENKELLEILDRSI
ncbi:MAG: redoxin domain-containing protein [Deltaproteobacteria bacterium]|nr:redoxin domain-containing protein [Deltaproteobacteria bacterium]